MKLNPFNYFFMRSKNLNLPKAKDAPDLKRASIIDPLFYGFYNLNFKNLLIFLSALIILNSFIYGLVFLEDKRGVELYFFDVGQGDAQMVKISGVNFLIDSGKDGKIISNLEKIIPFYRKKIDVAFISHGQRDHLGGFFNVIKKYNIGAVIYSGEDSDLVNQISVRLKEFKIPMIVLGKGDKVIFGDNTFDILWPDLSRALNNQNDNSMVVKFVSPEISSLYTADISLKVEKLLTDLKVDILKVPHHGSKYSSSLDFLKKVSPKISVVEVGKNSYGHPTKEAMGRIKEVGSLLFRTDEDGMIKIFNNGGKIEAFRLDLLD